MAAGQAAAGMSGSWQEVRKARGRKLPRLLSVWGYTAIRITHDKEDAVKNRLTAAIHSETFRSVAIALLMVTVAILLSACAGGGEFSGTGE
jgi:hypothetical protein